MCVFFKATLCSMFLQICLYDIDKLNSVGQRTFDTGPKLGDSFILEGCKCGTFDDSRP